MLVSAPASLAAAPPESPPTQHRHVDHPATPWMPEDGRAAQGSGYVPEVEFRAGTVELDAGLQRLRLKGNVQVVADRYRLTADALKLERGSRGLEIEGDGSVAFCRCDGAPITFGFSAATVAPPTDLLLYDPTLRIGGVPVCWVPVLWLRSRRRVGLLAPTLAWRGADGLLAGSGVHWPMGVNERGLASAELEVRLAGYAAGGIEQRGTLTTRTSVTSWRWDWLGTALLGLHSHGSAGGGTPALGAWRVDVLRGSRALEAAGSLRAVASPHDRAIASVAYVDHLIALGWGIRGVGVRAAAWDAADAVGPWMGVSAGRILGGGHDVRGSAAGWISRGTGADTSTWSISSSVGGTAHATPFVAEWRAGGNGSFIASRASSDTSGAGGARVRVGLPLVKALGRPRVAWSHWLEPFALAAAVREQTEERAGSRSSAFAGGGLRTALESGRASGGAELTSAIGATWSDAVRALPTATVQVRADSDLLGGSGRSTVLLRDGIYEIAMLSSWRVGLVESLHVAGSLDGASAETTRRSRWLSREPWEGPTNPWVSASGWSGGSSLVIPWANWLATNVGVDMDISRRELLAATAGAAYRHPCGCLAVSTEGQSRLGRRGYDVSVAVDLMP